jgi:phosphoribosylformylglycinamidine cyclo-ligase
LAEEIISIAGSFNIDARVVGRVEPFEGKKLTIKTEEGEFVY